MRLWIIDGRLFTAAVAQGNSLLGKHIMRIIKTVTASLALGATMLLGSTANAALYSYTSVVTLCTGTCASIVSLDVGSTITGLFDISTTPGGSFGDADITSTVITITNPALPTAPPVGDPVNDNPLILDSSLGVGASNGTGGTTDLGNQINGGQMAYEFLVPPFSSNGAYVIIDLATGNGQVCLFYATAGCIPGATQAVVFEGSFQLVPVPAAVWLFGSALGLLGLGTRRKA
jgi:hypothetical protein